MTHAVNGIPAGQLDGVTWQKSRRSNPSGNCVELALLPSTRTLWPPDAVAEPAGRSAGRAAERVPEPDQ